MMGLMWSWYLLYCFNIHSLYLVLSVEIILNPKLSVDRLLSLSTKYFLDLRRYFKLKSILQSDDDDSSI
jgi:hypothetical protein